MSGGDDLCDLIEAITRTERNRTGNVNVINIDDIKASRMGTE